MLPVELQYNEEIGKWVVTKGAEVVTTEATKGTALDKARGYAQSKADERGITTTIQLYSKSGVYQRAENVNPAP